MDTTNEPKSGYGVSVIVALLIIIGLGGWFAYYISHTQPLVDDTLRDQFVWHITPGQPLPDKIGPRTKVTLQIADAVLPVGTYDGNCELIDAKKTSLMTDELSGVICRNGTTGMEVGIFKQNGELLIKQGPIKTENGRGQDFVPVVQQTTS
ncbi:MAG TPA: hypothetical protein VHD31_01415 [Candidatus Paceibacterota bacterium]|nr:hypothetical protein [Candidatus Paceibacterota bacterium]